MSKITPERAALIERIKAAAAALEIPKEAVDHVVKHGTSYHRSKACKVLCDFAVKYGVSLDWLITDDIEALLKYAAIGHKITMASPQSKPEPVIPAGWPQSRPLRIEKFITEKTVKC